MVLPVPVRFACAPRRWRFPLVVLGVLACVTLASDRAAASGELRIGISRVPATLDPAALAAGPELMALRLLFQGLVEFGERGDIGPALATQWTVSRDGLTWTFRLRSGVQLADGTPLTPDDVVASLARHVSNDEPRDPGVPWARFFRGANRIVREVRRGEPGTVQIHLSQPFSPLLALLTHPALAIVVIRGDAESRPVGTGLYRVVEHGPGRLVLESSGSGDRPRAERVAFSEVPDDAAGIAGLAPSGTLDVYFPQAPPGWAGLGLQVLSGPAWRVGLLALRTDQGLLSKKALRQAIALSLDPGLIRPALGRWAAPLVSYLPPGAWGVRDTPPPPYDVTRARKILAQLGVVDPTLTLVVSETLSGPDAPRVAEALRLSLGPAGIRVQVRAETEEAARAAMRRGEVDLGVHEGTLEVNDPHFFFQALLTSDAAAAPGAATNVAFFRSLLVDGMLLRASQLAFRPERLRLYQRLQVYLAEEVPYVPLFVRLQWVVARPGVHDLRLDPGGLHRLERVWVEAPADVFPPPPLLTVPPPPRPPAVPMPGRPTPPPVFDPGR